MENCVVEIGQGKLKGKVEKDFKGNQFYSFQGIPYAKPPLGNLRFKAPQPPEHWSGIRDATTEASESLSQDFFEPEKIVGSDDCLYLNVYTPTLLKDGSAPKPVMFWIHGGGFTKGSSHTKIYGPEYLVTGDVVLVTINYRLGILGFLRLENPTLGVPGNAGMKDMVLALKWVQKNIRTFGGDPNNVTIFGESAGSAAVHSLILSPMAKGLFHRAIMQSGCVLNPWVFGKEKATTVTKVLGFESNDEKEILEFLQGVPAEKVFEAQLKIPEPASFDRIRPFGVVIETNATEPAFFSEHPLETIKSGNYNKVPLLIGYTSREGMYVEIEHKRHFGGLKLDGDLEPCIPYFYNIQRGTDMSLKIASKLKEAYFGHSELSLDTVDEYLKLQTDVMFFSGIFDTIKYHVRNLNFPIYFYILSAETGVNLVKKLGKLDRPGVCHADDIGYLFKTRVLPDIEENSIEDLIINRMVKLWTTFAKTGNPNPTESNELISVTWRPVTQNCYNCLDIGNELKCVENSDVNRLKVWDEISELAKKTKH